MKTILLTDLIVVFFLFCSERIQAQTTNQHLDQIELMNQFIGTWKIEMGKDTIVISEYKPFKPGMIDGYVKVFTKKEAIMEYRQLLEYDKKMDKIIQTDVFRGQNNRLLVLWFTSKNSYTVVLQQDISYPDYAVFRAEGEIKSPDLIVNTLYKNNIPYQVQTLNRE